MLKLSVNQATTLNWPLERDLRYYAELGVEAVSLQIRKVEAHGTASTKRLLQATGLTVASVLSTGFFTLDDPARWPGQVERARGAIDLAKEVGAEALVVISGPAGALSYEEAEKRFLDVLGKLLREAQQAKVPLMLEPNHALRVDLGYIHTLHDALDLADKVDSPWFKICFEMNNAWIERRLYDNIRTRWRRIGIVQINDFKAGTLCTPARVPLGDGIIPLERIFRAFRDAGYSGFFDLELVGPDIEQMGYEEALRRSLDWTKRLAGV